MQFLYPTSRQFPHDEVCERIVRALHARDWKVPGFSVTFDNYGSGEQKLRYVSVIENDELDVRLWFCRPQGRMPGGRFNDIAAVSEVRLPRRLLHVFEDNSGPSYCVYVGDDWARDRTRWWTAFNQRLKGEPRLCLRYSGSYTAGRLTATVDSREYAPTAGEPTYYPSIDIFAAFRGELGRVTYRSTVRFLHAAARMLARWLAADARARRGKPDSAHTEET